MRFRFAVACSSASLCFLLAFASAFFACVLVFMLLIAFSCKCAKKQIHFILILTL